MGINVTFFSKHTGQISSYALVTIETEDILKVEVKSVVNTSEDNIKTIENKMSIASATDREIKTILLGVRIFAV